MVAAIVCKPDGAGGLWRILAHDDGTVELLHRPAPRTASRTLVGRMDLYRVRRYVREHGIGEDGWQPE